MRTEAITIAGIGPLREPVAVNLAELPGKLVVLDGTNGAGKSTFLSCLLALITRKMADGQSLKDYAVARDSYVEGVVHHAGKSYRIKQTVDSVSGAQTALMVDAETGTPIVDTLKVSDVDAEVAKRFPPESLLTTSIFGQQQKNGFVDLDSAKRVKVINRATGNDHLEGMAEQCRKLHREAAQKLETVVARIADERARGGDAALLERHLIKMREHAEKVGLQLAEAERALTVAQEQDKAWREQQELIRERQRLTETEGRLTQDLRAIGSKLEHYAELAKDADAVRAAASRQVELRRLVGEARPRGEDLRRERDAHAEEMRQAGLELERANVAYEKEASIVAHLTKEHGNLLSEVAEAQGLLGPAVALVKELGHRLDAYTQAILRLRSFDKDCDIERIDLLEGGLRDVAEWLEAGNTPLYSAEHARETLAKSIHLGQVDVVPALSRAERRLGDVRERLTVGREKLRDIQRTADRMEEVETIAADLAAYRDERDRLLTSLDELKAQHANAVAKHIQSRAAHEEHLATVAKLHAELAKDALAARAAEVLTAEVKVENLIANQRRALTQREEAWAALEKLPEPTAGDPPGDIGALAASVETCRKEATSAVGEVARAEAGLATATESEARLAEMVAQRAAIEEDAADWKLLALSLGREGLQAVELDAAGPELTELANDLLHSCYGPRFSVSFQSSREKSKKGAGFRDGCWVMVSDNETSRYADAKHFCGGEKVFIGEACDLALTMLGCRRAGMERPTIARDERGAALAAENGPLYVSMLRRAAELVGADKVLLVTHDEALKGLADCRLRFSDGTVRVEACDS